MKRYLLVFSLIALMILSAPACSLVNEQTQPNSAQAVGSTIAADEIAVKLRAVGIQVNDLPSGYRLTIAETFPEDSDIPQNGDQGMAGFLLRQFESQGKMTIVNKIVAYRDEAAASQAFPLFTQGVMTYSDELKINGITGDSMGSQENFKIGPLTQSNASFVFRKGQFISIFLFVNQSGHLDQQMMNKTTNLVFERIQKIQ